MTKPKQPEIVHVTRTGVRRQSVCAAPASRAAQPLTTQATPCIDNVLADFGRPVDYDEAKELKRRIEEECGDLRTKIHRATEHARKTGDYMDAGAFRALVDLHERRKRQAYDVQGLLTELKREKLRDLGPAYLEKDRFFWQVARERLAPDVFNDIRVEAERRWLEANDDETSGTTSDREPRSAP